MDETLRDAYVGAVVNLLLLLSALLSALSGVSPQARVAAPLTASHEVGVAEVRSTAAVRAAARPSQALPDVFAVSRAPLTGSIAALPSIAALLTNRRRE